MRKRGVERKVLWGLCVAWVAHAHGASEVGNKIEEQEKEEGKEGKSEDVHTHTHTHTHTQHALHSNDKHTCLARR